MARRLYQCELWLDHVLFAKTAAKPLNTADLGLGGRRAASFSCDSSDVVFWGQVFQFEYDQSTTLQ